MQEILICAALYAAFGAFDLYPLFRDRQWGVLRISLPIYAVTLAVDILWSMHVIPVSITEILERALSIFVK